jgi:hypothetical protein
MRQPVLAVVVADFGQPVDVLAGVAGTTYNLRADFLADPPDGAVAFVWKVVPKSAVRWGEFRTEPDFKREVTALKNGALYVSAFDSNGFRLDSQTVKIRPGRETDEA